MAVIRHEETWLELEELGKNQPYRPTYRDQLALGRTHRQLLGAPLKPGSVSIDIGIPGSLRREDAAKLYELAFFGEADILELGCARGLSTAIMAKAILDSGRPRKLTTVDLEPRMIEKARANLTENELLAGVEFITGDASVVCESLLKQHHHFDLIFVDHSHAHTDVLAICKLLPQLVSPGGFVLFHDFNDRRNRNGEDNAYGVYTAVVDGLPAQFTFFGIFGCTGLYRNGLRSQASELAHSESSARDMPLNIHGHLAP